MLNGYAVFAFVVVTMVWYLFSCIGTRGVWSRRISFVLYVVSLALMVGWIVDTY